MADIAEDSVDLVQLALIGGLVFAGWYVWTRFLSPNAPGSLTSEATSGVADEYVDLTSGAPVLATNNVALPTGQVVAVSSLSWRIDSAGNSYTVIGGTPYQLSARNAQGNYTLTPDSLAAPTAAPGSIVAGATDAYYDAAYAAGTAQTGFTGQS